MTPYYERDGITIYCGDCLEIMPQLEPGIDAIICDLPYGTTACSWDVVIPFEPLWAHYKRLIKPRGAIVLFGSEPFSSLLRVSNLEWYKYDWVWDKKYHSNPFLAKHQPLRITEMISVFSGEKEVYYPQMIKRPEKWIRKRPSFGHKNGEIFGNKNNLHPNSSNKELMHPVNILDFPLDNPFIRTTIHPTQKPVALLQYLIRTYTNPGELILDNCAGSGTTGLAALNEGRRCIMIEQDEGYCKIAVDRLRQPSLFYSLAPVAITA